MYRVRLAGLGDKEAICNLIKNSDYRQCYRNAPVNGYTEDILLNNIQNEIEGVKDTSGLYVLENDTNEIMGACSFYFTFHRNGYTFIRFFIKNTIKETDELELFNKVLDLCFLSLNFNKVNIELKSSQLKYAEVYRKSGFIKELCLREHFYCNGAYEDIIHLGLTRESYLSKSTVEQSYGEENFVLDKDYLLQPDILPTKQLLIGEKVDLTALVNEDESLIYKACQSSDFMHYASIAATGPAQSQYAKVMVSSSNDYMTFKNGILLGIRNKEGDIVGIIGSSNIEHRNRNLMISLEIFNTTERGKGYGSEAIRMFTDFAFLEMNMHRVYLGCFEFNSHAGYLYERLGFKPEGMNKDFVYRNGKYYSEIAFGVIKTEWLGLRGYL